MKKNNFVICLFIIYWLRKKLNSLQYVGFKLMNVMILV